VTVAGILISNVKMLACDVA